MIKLLFIVLTLTNSFVIYARDIHIDTNYTSFYRSGSANAPYNKFSDFEIMSGQSIYISAGSVIREQVDIQGKKNITISTYGQGERPIIDLDNKFANGIKLLSAQNIVIENVDIRHALKACVHVVGSANFKLRNLKCSNSVIGIQVNDGKYKSTGEILGNVISEVSGDGIGAWSLDKGIIIKNNTVSNFGNDGIDILGSYDSVIEGNTVHSSFDSVTRDGREKAGGRGVTHAGIKAGGNKTRGGGRNIVRSNTVYKVKNFGIFNRHAINNIYDSNICYENGVNYNFVKSNGPSLATIVNNTSRDATHEAGLKYDIFMPQKEHLVRANNNRWVEPVIKVKNIGVYAEKGAYLQTMAPFEQETVFK